MTTIQHDRKGNSVAVASTELASLDHTLDFSAELW